MEGECSAKIVQYFSRLLGLNSLKEIFDNYNVSIINNYIYPISDAFIKRFEKSNYRDLMDFEEYFIKNDYSIGMTSLDMSSLKRGRYVRFYSNNLTSVDFSSLERIDYNLQLQNNNLSNVDTLSNLTYVRYDVYLNNNPNLDSVYGLRNLSNFRYLYLDNRNYSVKAPYASPLCSALRSNSSKLRYGSVSNVCESQ